MNSPAVPRTNGTAHFFSFLYRPGEMNAHTCHRIHGDPRNSEATTGVHTQMIWKFSIGSMAMKPAPAIPVAFIAARPGAMMMSNRSLLK